jgi:myo-inositol-1(or 4)-monophosphatase
MSDPRSEVPESQLRQLEQTAVELVRLAGAEIQNALCRPFAVQYKDGTADDEGGYRNPVSEVDRGTEMLVRARLAERFPQHDIVGEELDEGPGRGADFVWAVDPIDGTSNFINGFPLFAASVGLLYRGYPLVGATWCSTSHALQSGVYHAHYGGGLFFEGRPFAPRLDRQLRRHLAAEPCDADTERTFGKELPWDTRHTGSCAIECAFTAAGLLRLSRLPGPKLWDCAGGIALVLAAGGEVRTLLDGAWQPFDCFEPPVPHGATLADLRHWKGSLILGDPEAVQLYTAAEAARAPNPGAASRGMRADH